MKYLTNALNYNRTIKEINIKDNEFGNQGAKYLSYILKNNNTIENLNLEHNGINNIGINYIAKSLKFNKGINELNLSLNDFNDNNLKYLTKSMENNYVIRNIKMFECIYYNGFYYDAESQFIESLILNNRKRYNIPSFNIKNKID